MSLLLRIEVISFFVVLLLQAIWHARGVLTERWFVLPPVIFLNLIVLTAGLEAYLSSPYIFGLVALGIATILSAVLEYLLLRLVYRLSLRSK